MCLLCCIPPTPQIHTLTHPATTHTHVQLHAVHTADARVITASDYTAVIQGVPHDVTEAELRGWCSHYGSGEGRWLLLSLRLWWNVLLLAAVRAAVV